MDDFDPDPDHRCCGCAGLERVPSCAAVLKGKAARTAAGFRHGRQRLPCIPITFRSSVSQTVATPLIALISLPLSPLAVPHGAARNPHGGRTSTA